MLVLVQDASGARCVRAAPELCTVRILIGIRTWRIKWCASHGYTSRPLGAYTIPWVGCGVGCGATLTDIRCEAWLLPKSGRGRWAAG